MTLQMPIKRRRITSNFYRALVRSPSQSVRTYGGLRTIVARKARHGFEVVERDRAGRERKIVALIRNWDDALAIALHLARDSRATVVDQTWGGCV